MRSRVIAATVGTAITAATAGVCVSMSQAMCCCEACARSESAAGLELLTGT